jgi:ribosomal protein S1
MENKKRERISKRKVEVQTEDVQLLNEVQEDDFELTLEGNHDEYNFILPNGEFDWDGYEAHHNHKLKPNHKVKTLNHKHIVYSHASNAQEMYNMYNNASFHLDEICELVEGSIMTGKLHSMSTRWATVDVNYREMLYIDLSREDRDVIADYRPGDEVSVKVLSDKTQAREYALASITEGAKQVIFAELRMAADEGGTAFMGKVTSMIPGGGYIVKVQGIECFMPGSLAGINKLADFESIVGTEMYVVPDSFSAKRGTIVVSHRAYLQAMIPKMIGELENNLDAVQKGFVTGTAKFGVFCEFNNCLTGMIHINDLSPEWSAKHKNNSIEPGDEIEFKIKEIVNNKKIILTQIEQVEVKEDNSWEEFTKDLQIPSVVTGKIRSVKDYGVFVGLHGTITGMAHVSNFEKNISLTERFTKGDEVAVEITKIDNDTKKVFLKVVGA